MLVHFGPFLRHTNDTQVKQGFQRSYSNLRIRKLHVENGQVDVEICSEISMPNQCWDLVNKENNLRPTQTVSASPGTGA